MQQSLKNQDETQINVAAWLLIVIGGYHALESFRWFVIWTFFYPGESYSPGVSLEPLLGVGFGVAGIFCGLGMLNRREKALGMSIALLWVYAIWVVLGMILNVIASISEQDYEIYSDPFSKASTVSGFAMGVVIAAACIWLAQRLSSPRIKVAYSD